MLRLEVDKADTVDGYKTPKYIQISGPSNILGRGYQASIRFPFTWLSRKHATITKVDGNCILESNGQNGVFVNNKRIEFTRLNKGDLITIGAGQKNATLDSVFNLNAGPYVTFSYHQSTKEMKDKENCYTDPLDPADVLQVEDHVNGQVVNSSYHLEDFNQTDAEDCMQDLTLVNQSLNIPPELQKTQSKPTPDLMQTAITTKVPMTTSTPSKFPRPGVVIKANTSVISPVKKQVITPKLQKIQPKPSPKPMQTVTSNSADITTNVPMTSSTPSRLPGPGVVIQTNTTAKSSVISPIKKQVRSSISSKTVRSSSDLLLPKSPGEKLNSENMESTSFARVASPLLNKRPRAIRVAAKACRQMLSNLNKYGDAGSGESSPNSQENSQGNTVKKKPQRKSAGAAKSKLIPEPGLVKDENVKIEELEEEVKMKDSKEDIKFDVNVKIEELEKKVKIEDSKEDIKLDVKPDIELETGNGFKNASKEIVTDSRNHIDHVIDEVVAGTTATVDAILGEENRNMRKRKPVSYVFKAENDEDDSDFLPDPVDLDDQDDPDVVITQTASVLPAKSLKLDPPYKMYPIGSGKGKSTIGGKAKNKKLDVKSDIELETVNGLKNDSKEIVTDSSNHIDNVISEVVVETAETMDAIFGNENRNMRKRKRVSYVLKDQNDEDDSDFLPDPVDLDDLDDPDVVITQTASVPPAKSLKLDPPYNMYPIGSGKGKSAIGGKAKNKKIAKYVDPEEENILNSWFNKTVPHPKARMVEVLDGLHRHSLFSFEDHEVFHVTYKSGDDNITPALLYDTQEYDVTVNIDAALFEHKLKLGQLNNNDMTRVLHLIRRSSTTLTIKDYDKPNPASKIKCVQQPTDVTIPLKQYQLDTLGWMCLVESQVEVTWSVSKLADWPEAEVDIEFDIFNKRAYFPPYPATPSTEYSVNIKGGILADEMGLGKTITVLALISANPGREIPRIPAPDVFRRHEELHIPTRATLVIAPSHLTAQWKLEAEKAAPSLTVLIITTKLQFEKYSYVDILRADLVIVSVQFLLSNKAYTSLPSGAGAETSFMNLLHKSGSNPLLEKGPNFSHFLWWRLVCDEAHELIKYERKLQGHKEGYGMQASNGLVMLEKFKAKYKWYMTGTPLPHAEASLRGALKFLEMKIDDQSLTYPDGSIKVDQESTSYLDSAKDGLYLSPIHKFILDTVYVRNTKQSIGMEYNVPEYIEELMLLTMSDVERGIYDRSSGEREKRQLCCHLQIASKIQMIAGVQQKSLEEVKDAMIEHTKKEIDRSQRNIEFTRDLIKQARTELAAETKPSMKTNIEARITRLIDTIKTYEETIKTHNSSLSYFENIVPRVTQSADEPCVICMDNIETLTLTPCGHLYCKKCIQPYVATTTMCPTCRKPCALSELVEVQDPRQRENLNKSAELQKLTEQFGTKMAYLIFYIRHMFKNDPKSRVIVFSQWDELLHKIGSTLNDNGIRNVFVKGNVHVRNKAIMSFRKQEKTRVIMLSLQNAASGTNLVEASHVILIDPVAGSKQEAVSVESQAIGRAHRMGQDKEITVVRMIIKDTIEHELYLRNNSDSIQQVELNFDQEESNTLGPQVVRKVRKVPKPTGVEVSCVSVFANDGASTSGGFSGISSSAALRRFISEAPRQKKRRSHTRGRRKDMWRVFGRRNFWNPWNDDDHDPDQEDCDCATCSNYF